MSELSFKALRHYNRQRDLEFQGRITDEQEEWNIVDRSNELAGEVGELCNMVKKVRRARLGMQRSDVTIEDIAEEIADIIICVDLFAMDLDIDLNKWVTGKFNRSSEKFGLDTKIPINEQDFEAAVRRDEREKICGEFQQITNDMKEFVENYEHAGDPDF